MKKEVINFKVFSLRNIENPFSRHGYRTYECVVDAKDLPNLDNWRDINVRDPKTTGSVPRAIRDSFRGNFELFLFMNRGILLSVKDVKFDQKESIATIELTDPEIHGIGDGGHTYSIIKENVSGLGDDLTQYVKVELITGFSLDDIALIIEGRNTSNQVKDQSLMELKNDFDELKGFLSESIREKISFSEYETDDTGMPKPVDIREVLALLTIFNKDHYNETVQPVIAYSSKQACLKQFSDRKSSYKKLYPIANDILKLHDHLYCALPKLYNEAARQFAGKSGGKFGSLTGVTPLKNSDNEGKKKKNYEQLLFSNKQSDYTIPAGFIYPLLNAFRAFLVEENGVYKWGKGINPLEMVESELTLSLANILGEEALKNANPNKTGKSTLLWRSCYQHAELFFLRMK